MRLRVMLPVLLAATFVLGACGSSGKPGSSEQSTTSGPITAPASAIPAGVNPSTSAKMVCAAEVKTELAETLGIAAKSVTKPTWKDHVYSCKFVYPKGSFVLSVKELDGEKSTTDYYNAQVKKLGVADKLFGLGQGAFIAKNGDVVVRKDYKVLVVDVQGVPKALNAFVPAMVRSDVSSNIAAVIMSCWVGA